MLIQADIMQWAAEYDGPPFHSLLTDPPYHLTEITKRFGKTGAAPAQFGSDGAFQRASKGFMGRTWDGGDIAFQPETWAALARHLYPGAFGMAFASSRGWHRMACAIEDAGLIIHPVIMCWTFLSGFPKATDISAQSDRAAGAERPVVGQKKHAPKFAAKDFGYREKDNGYNSRERESFDLTGSATPLAAAWEGHRYGRQALKPSLEPLIVFQKPYVGRPVECITSTGAGALNIDGGRIGTGERVYEGGLNHYHNLNDDNWQGKGMPAGETTVNGRWPSNLILTHSPLCTDTCVPECPVQRLGEQSGESSYPRHTTKRSPAERGKQYEGGYSGQEEVTIGYNDSGTASRMFFQADYMYERLENADPAAYFPKASTSEREAGLDGFAPTTVDDGRDTPIDNAYLRGETQRRNIHPTIKPISLNKYLATLLLPPVEYGPRRLLIPFAGVASEIIGAELAGWESVTGIEREADHVAIGRARLEFWRNASRRLMTTDPETILAMQAEATIPNLLDLIRDAA